MAHKLPLYYPLIKTEREAIKNNDNWDKAKDYFDKNEYKKSIIETFNYANSHIFKGVNLKEDIDITRVHGAIEVHITLNDSHLSLSTTIAKVTEETALTPLFRRVAEINFSDLDFAQIRIKNNLITINYAEPIELCTPKKVISRLQEILFNADEYYNEFIYLYNAQEAVSVPKKSLNETQKSTAIKQIRAYLDEVDSYIDYYEKNDKSNYAWDILIITLYRISNMTYLNGYIKYEIFQKLSMLHNRDMDFQDRISRGKIYINELKALSDSDYEKVLYFREDVISMLRVSDNEIVKEWVSSYSDTLKKMLDENNHFGLSYYAYAMFLRLIYHYNISKKQKKAIEKVLTKISNEEVDSAKEPLLTLYNQFIDQELEDSDRFKIKTSHILGLLIASIFLVDIIKKLF